MRFLYARLLTRPVIADGELSLACPAAICWGGRGGGGAVLAASRASCSPGSWLGPGPSGPALVRYTVLRRL